MSLGQLSKLKTQNYDQRCLGEADLDEFHFPPFLPGRSKTPRVYLPQLQGCPRFAIHPGATADRLYARPLSWQDPFLCLLFTFLISLARVAEGAAVFTEVSGTGFLS